MSEQPSGKTLQEYIRFEGVHKRFGTNHVLRGLNLSVRKGETLAIIGQSGTGKSVTLRLMLALMSPDDGDIHFLGKSVLTMNESEINDLRKHFGMVFQMSALFDSLTVGENVAFGIEGKDAMPPDELRERVEKTLRSVGLSNVYDKMPAELSGGMRKRVGVARAVAMEPEILLYDEPTTGLDPITSDAINDLILNMQKEYNVTGVVVTHDMKSAYKVADRIVMLHQGQVVGEGTAAEIQNSSNPMIQQFIDGRADGPIAAIQ